MIASIIVVVISLIVSALWLSPIFSGDSMIPSTGTQDNNSTHTHTITTISAVAPTCTKTGLTEGKKCSTCYEVIVEQETIPTLEHSWSNYTCERCGITQELELDPKNNNILTIEQIDWEINSANGVEPDIKYTNRSDKQIAYIWFTIKFYDRMGKPAYCSIRDTHTRKLRVTGPIDAGKQDTSYWDPIIYNGAVAAIKPLSIEIEFTDGTRQTIQCTGRYWYDSSYYGGDLKD